MSTPDFDALTRAVEQTAQKYVPSHVGRAGQPVFEIALYVNVLTRAVRAARFDTAMEAMGNIFVWVWRTRDGEPAGVDPARDELLSRLHHLRYSIEVHLRQLALASLVLSERLSRRTRYAADLAVRMLPPVDRQRYREEWAAEIMDIARRDQAAYAFRLLSRAWSLRRSLKGTPSHAPRNILIFVGVAVPGGDALAAVCGLDWQATVLGVGWTVGLMWVVTSKERTRNLVTLIREARTSKTPTQK